MSKRQSIKPAEPRTPDSGHSEASPAKVKNRTGEKKAAEVEAYEQKKELVARLRRMGYSFRRIAKYPGVNLSKSSVHELFEKILDEGARGERRKHVEAWRAEKLEELRELKSHTYDTFLKSGLEEVQTIDETINTPAGKGKPKSRSKHGEKKKNRDGNVQALQLIKDIIELECHLHGILKPADVMMNNTHTTVHFNLPATMRNGAKPTVPFTLPERKQIKAATILTARPPPSEVATVERSEPLPGSQDVR